MIKAIGTNEAGDVATVLLGLTRENVELLIKGNPILVKLRELHPGAPDIGIVIIGNETMDELHEDFRSLGPIREWRDG